jgi:hypothetical protein
MMTAGSTSTPYIPRTPADTPCYKIVQDNLATFLAEREAANRPLPKYVVDEFDSYLRCGLFPFGFLRIKCLDCGDETQVPFSCKGRVVCASCASKRMVESAAHLVDNVLPLLPYRQFVVTFPIPLRYWMQSNNGLFSKIHGLVIRAINRYYIEKAKKDGTDNPAPGSISFTQRWGSALNVDPHLHILCPDGVYFRENGAPRFHFLDPISEKEVAHLLESISQSVLRYLRKKKYIDADGKVVDLPPADKMFQDNESIAMATEASVGGRIAFGPNAGKRVTRIASGFGYQEEIPVGKGKRCYSIKRLSEYCFIQRLSLDKQTLMLPM